MKTHLEKPARPAKAIINCLLLAILLFHLSFNALAQFRPSTQYPDENNLFTHANKIYGPDLRLISGKAYMPANSMADGTPYFISENFLKGKVYVKNKVFDQLSLKYNLVKDQMILYDEIEDNKAVNIILRHAFIDSLQIGKHLFVPTQKILGKDSLNLYTEVIFKGNRINFLAMHSKNFREVYNNITPYGTFSKTSTNFYIQIDQQILQLKNKKDIFKLMPGNKKYIRIFMRENRIRLNKANHNDLVKLSVFLDRIMNMQENQNTKNPTK